MTDATFNAIKCYEDTTTKCVLHAESSAYVTYCKTSGIEVVRVTRSRDGRFDRITIIND
jgi:uncharacterized protein YqkB